MNKKKLLKRINEKLDDVLWYRLIKLENIKRLYEQNPNLPANARMANVQLAQNDIIALKKRMKKRIRFSLLALSK